MSKFIMSKKYKGLCLWCEDIPKNKELDIDSTDKNIEKKYSERIKTWKEENPRYEFWDYDIYTRKSERYNKILKEAGEKIWINIIMDENLLNTLIVWKDI